MPECKQPRMQRLAGERFDAVAKRWGQPVRLGAEGLAVIGIADDRMADMRHMHTDLMRAAGFEPAFDERSLRHIRSALAKTFEHGVAGDCPAGVVPVFWHDRAADTVG